MKKRIALLVGLLALCIAGQVLLRPCLGSDTAGASFADSLEGQKVGDLDSTESLLEKFQETKETDDLQGRLIQQLSLMIAFVAVIGIGAWYFCKKMSCNWASNRGKHITVTETVSLGQRKLLHLVQVGSKQYLLSSTNENIRLLSDVTDTLEETKA